MLERNVGPPFARTRYLLRCYCSLVPQQLDGSYHNMPRALALSPVLALIRSSRVAYSPGLRDSSGALTRGIEQSAEAGRQETEVTP